MNRVERYLNHLKLYGPEGVLEAANTDSNLSKEDIDQIEKAMPKKKKGKR